MEFKEFLIKHGVLQEFCNEVRRQINKQSDSRCIPPSLDMFASIVGLHWCYTRKEGMNWVYLYNLEVIEVAKYAHKFKYYYNLDEKIPKCLKRL